MTISPAPRNRAAICNLAGLVLASLLLGGCASLSESQCLRGNWATIGHDDAVAGHSPRRVEAHADACAKHGVYVDTAAWEDGYFRGLEEFCSPRRGFAFGRSGGTYHGQCPPPIEPSFLAAFDLGTDVRAIDEEITGLGRDIETARKEARDKDASERERRSAERHLDRLKAERERRERERDRLLQRARQRGYGAIR